MLMLNVVIILQKKTAVVSEKRLVIGFLHVTQHALVFLQLIVQTKKSMNAIVVMVGNIHFSISLLITQFALCIRVFHVYQHKNNTRKTWGVIKKVTDKKKKLTPDQFVINNTIATYTNVISDSFNIFYVKINPHLAKQIIDRDSLTYIPNNMRGSVKDVTYSEVSKINNALKEFYPWMRWNSC